MRGNSGEEKWEIGEVVGELIYPFLETKEVKDIYPIGYPPTRCSLEHLLTSISGGSS